MDQIDRMIEFALNEDIGYGDITTQTCVPEETGAKGYFLCKQEAVICGLNVMRRVFEKLDANLVLIDKVKEGQCVAKGTVIAEIEGPARAILTGERTALNFLQHLSGIATKTADIVKQVEGAKVRITDTRKTTPGLRLLEKYAVRVGGGYNHRIGLSDGILIKDNHIIAAGGIKKAVEAVRTNIPHTLKIEVETCTLQEVEEALLAKADIIMLDNMTVDLMTEAVKLVNGRALTEASGNMGERDLKQVALTGVDIISIGGLTHSVIATDISLKFSFF